MRNIIYILLILPIIGLSQDFNYGIKLGANYSGFHSTSSAFTTNFGPQVGGFISFPLNKNRFNLRGEILYSKKGGEFADIISTGTSVTVIGFDYILNYIDIPLLVEYELFRHFSFFAGLQIGILLSENLEINGSEVSIDSASGFDSGLISGFVIDLSQKLFVEAKYNYGLSKVFENRDERNSTISLGLAYKLD